MRAGIAKGACAIAQAKIDRIKRQQDRKLLKGVSYYVDMWREDGCKPSDMPHIVGHIVQLVAGYNDNDF